MVMSRQYHNSLKMLTQETLCWMMTLSYFQQYFSKFSKFVSDTRQIRMMMIEKQTQLMNPMPRMIILSVEFALQSVTANAKG